MIATRPKSSGPRFDVCSAPIDDARIDELTRLAELLSGSYPDSSPHTVWNLPWTWHRYRVVRDESKRIVAAAALAELDPCRFEIRGLAVDPEVRGRGLASRLVRDLLVRADKARRETVCMTRKPEFFSRFGFHCAMPDWLPEHRWVPAPEPDVPRVAMRRIPFREPAA